MQKSSSILLSLVSLLLASQPVYAQTSKDINALLKKSKLVDTGRTVNSRVDKNAVTISTFCDANATDKDVKITALLMAKELKQHYKSILRVTALFFDPKNVDTYRQVEIREGDIVLVDMGKPINAVLSQISVTNGKVAASQTKSASSVSSVSTTRVYSQSVSPTPVRGVTLPTSEFASFTSLDDDVTIAYPKGWLPGYPELGVVLRVVHRNASYSLYRFPKIAGTSLESLANQQEAAIERDHKTYRRRTFSSRTCNGMPAYYLEGTGTMNGVDSFLRATLVQGPRYFYMVTLLSPSADDSEMRQMYDKLVSSLSVSKG